MLDFAEADLDLRWAALVDRLAAGLEPEAGFFEAPLAEAARVDFAFLFAISLLLADLRWIEQCSSDSALTTVIIGRFVGEYRRFYEFSCGKSQTGQESYWACSPGAQLSSTRDIRC